MRFLKKMARAGVCLLCLSLIAGIVPAFGEEAPAIQVIFNGQAVAFDSPPVMENGTILADAGSLSKALNFRLAQKDPNSFSLSKDSLIIELQADSNQARVNGEQIELQAAPRLQNGKLFVPLRFIAEADHLPIGWDQASGTATIGSNYKVVAYYIEWGIYGRNFQVSHIDAAKVTHINYAFANIKDGVIALGDPWADTDRPSPGDCEDDSCKKGNFNQLNILKSLYPHLQTLISVGGWSWSGEFSNVALTDESRTKFADSVVQFLRDYGFDGVDLDWEYPVAGGMEENARRPEDKQNFTLLLQTIRQKLDEAGKTDGGKHYLLTIAAGSAPSYIENTEIEEVAEAVDWINVMGYDFHVAGESVSGHNAPLYFDPDDPSDHANRFYAAAAVNGFLSAGVPSEKIVLGMPFYGHGFTGCSVDENGQYQTCAGPSKGTWEDGSLDYRDLEQNYVNQNGFVRYWNDSAKVPWLFNAEDGTFISYDDVESYGYKIDFIKSHKLGGAMFWEITADGDKTLLNKLSDLLLH